jgi:hypothetical protein
LLTQQEFLNIIFQKDMAEHLSHHLVYGTLQDFLTGEELTDTDDERHRQQISRMMVDARGYRTQDLEPRLFIETLFTRNFVRSTIDLTVTIDGRQFMIIRYGPGSLVSRERSALAAARLLNSRYRIPLAVVTNARDALLLDTVTGKVLKEGMECIPTREEAVRLIPHLVFLPPQDKEKRVREQRILNAFDLERCCIGI